MKNQAIKIIKNNPTLDVRNLDALPWGLNCSYLEVREVPEYIEKKPVYIAVRWRRKISDLTSGTFIQLKHTYRNNISVRSGFNINY